MWGLRSTGFWCYLCALDQVGPRNECVLGASRSLRGLGDCADNAWIGAAAADVAAHPRLDLFGRVGMALGHAGNAGHYLARRAITALERIVLDEGGLQRMKLG